MSDYERQVATHFPCPPLVCVARECLAGTPWCLEQGVRTVSVQERYLLLLTCRDEQHQVELLERFQGEGIPCKALLL